MARVKFKVKQLIEKSKDSALLAVEIYNKPRTTFRSSGFIVLMHIAWTSLFHAIFEKEGVSYFHKKDRVRYIKISGERKAWELAECIKKYYGKDDSPERKNLEFFIGLRDKIEHRFTPELDQDIFGECQAMLINYEYLLGKEFGDENTINENLAFSLQFSKLLHPEQIRVIKKRQTEDYKNVKRFVLQYRRGLKKEIIESLNYNFRVYLIPKVGNHKTSSDFAIEFVKYDLTNPAEADKYKELVVAVKEKQVPIQGFRAGEVAKRVFDALKVKMPNGWKFNASSHHVRCWKYFKIRPPNGSTNPEKTDSKYCFYDQTFEQYGYTEEWINFLIKKLGNKSEYAQIMKTR
jgi:hypothetical protein